LDSVLLAIETDSTKIKKMARTLVLGSEEKCCTDVRETLTSVLGDGFDFIAVPLVHPRNRRDAMSTGVSKSRDTAFTKSDLMLQSSNWTRSVVGKVSGWLWPGIESVGESGEISAIRRNAEDALKQVTFCCMFVERLNL
jgi:hypothetical protein